MSDKQHSRISRILSPECSADGCEADARGRLIGRDLCHNHHLEALDDWMLACYGCGEYQVVVKGNRRICTKCEWEGRVV